MNNIDHKPMTFNDLPSFVKQRLWNNKSITLEIIKKNLSDQNIEIKVIKNETNNTKSPK